MPGRRYSLLIDLPLQLPTRGISGLLWHSSCSWSFQSILAFTTYLLFWSTCFRIVSPPKVIRNYLSSIRLMASKYNIPQTGLDHYAISNYLRSISINSNFRPTPRGIFDLTTLYHISISCDILHDPELYRAIFLTAFYGFLRMSNIAPHSAKQFSKHRHFLRQDLIFAHPGAHLIIKWTKTLQDHRAHHIIQLPSLKNPFLCPVRALTKLVQSRPLPPDAPLFANNFPPFAQVIDSHIHDSLKKVLIHRNIPLQGNSFHTFRRSGATLAFDNNVSLQNIQAHGLWQSTAVWTYLQNASLAPSIIPNTFASLVSSSF